MAETHGEKWYRNKCGLKEKDGFEHNLNPELGCPDRMSRKEAVKYYNAKIFSFWVGMLDASLPQTKREEITSYLMFRNPQKYKELISA